MSMLVAVKCLNQSTFWPSGGLDASLEIVPLILFSLQPLSTMMNRNIYDQVCILKQDLGLKQCNSRFSPVLQGYKRSLLPTRTYCHGNSCCAAAGYIRLEIIRYKLITCSLISSLENSISVPGKTHRPLCINSNAPYVAPTCCALSVKHNFISRSGFLYVLYMLRVPLIVQFYWLCVTHSVMHGCSMVGMFDCTLFNTAGNHYWKVLAIENNGFHSAVVLLLYSMWRALKVFKDCF